MPHELCRAGRSAGDITGFGLAIGFTVAAGAYAVGGVSGTAFNPAVTFSAMLMGLLDWPNFWIYLLAQVLAAAAAAITFRYLNPGDVLDGSLPELSKSSSSGKVAA